MKLFFLFSLLFPDFFFRARFYISMGDGEEGILDLEDESAASNAGHPSDGKDEQALKRKRGKGKEGDTKDKKNAIAHRGSAGGET